MEARDEYLRAIPWILWFIWKACNHKIFEDINEPPHEILTHATQEAETWIVMNTRETNQEPESEVLVSTGNDVFLNKCQVNGFWGEKDNLSRHRWRVVSMARSICAG